MHKFLQPLLGTKWAPILFAVANCCWGAKFYNNGNVSRTNHHGRYLNLRIQPWVRRIITRLIAIVPAVIVITIFGEGVTGKLLIVSNFEFAIGFAIIPLIHFVSDKTKMNGFHIGKITQTVSWLVALVIVILNAKLVYDEIQGWLENSDNPIVLWLTGATCI
jgi:manganese transport protein